MISAALPAQSIGGATQTSQEFTRSGHSTGTTQSDIQQLDLARQSLPSNGKGPKWAPNQISIGNRNFFAFNVV